MATLASAVASKVGGTTSGTPIVSSPAKTSAPAQNASSSLSAGQLATQRAIAAENVIAQRQGTPLQSTTSQSYLNPGSQLSYSNPGNQVSSPTAVVDSSSAKQDLTKIQSDFQSMLSNIQNKQNYNQAGLDVTNSVVDLMKSKGIADTSETARRKLAEQAGINDYNSANAESNKKLGEAIMSSKAVGSAMSQLQPGTPEYDSAMGKVAGAVAGKIPIPPPAAEPLTSMGTKVSEDPMTAAYDKTTKEIDDNNSSITSALSQLRTGAIPLTSDQQAVVDSTQRSFDNAIAQQKTANQSQENTVKMASFRSGSEYTPEVSSSIIKNVIDSNVLKIKEYDMQAITAISKLKQDFKDANYKNIKEGYETLNKTLKDKQDNLLSLMKLSHDYEKESLNYSLDVLKYKETVRSNKATEGIASVKAANDANKGDGLTAGQINTSINQLNNAFRGDSTVVNFKKVSEANTFVQNMSSTTTNPADDQALIYAFAKALDPDSAVKEGEYTTIQKYSQSLVNKYGKSFTQALNGTGFLSEKAREDIKKTIKSKYVASKQGYDDLASQYQQDINDLKNGVTRDLLNYDYNKTETSDGGKMDLQAIMDGVKAETDAEVKAGTMTKQEASDKVYKAVKDARLHNESLTSVGGDTNQASRAARNNNPLNIKASATTKTYPGVVGIESKPAADGGNFLTFKSPQDGFNAAKTLITSGGYKNLTLDAAMKRWSGGGYGADVAPQFKGRTIASLSDNELQTLIKSMAKREGYYA